MYAGDFFLWNIIPAWICGNKNDMFIHSATETVSHKFQPINTATGDGRHAT